MRLWDGRAFCCICLLALLFRRFLGCPPPGHVFAATHPRLCGFAPFSTFFVRRTTSAEDVRGLFGILSPLFLLCCDGVGFALLWAFVQASLRFFFFDGFLTSALLPSGPCCCVLSTYSVPLSLSTWFSRLFFFCCSHFLPTQLLFTVGCFCHSCLFGPPLASFFFLIFFFLTSLLRIPGYTGWAFPHIGFFPAFGGFYLLAEGIAAPTLQRGRPLPSLTTCLC